MGNGQHEQKVDKLQILNPNCMCMVIELNCLKYFCLKSNMSTTTGQKII
jgi:hypothetical protein